jgi:hypothetical protein
VAGLSGGKAGSGRLKRVFKGQNPLSSPDGQVAGVRSRSQALGDAVGLDCLLGTRLRNLSTWSRDWEVTPPCSIRPLPFGDVLVVWTRKLTNEKVKKKKKDWSEK